MKLKTKFGMVVSGHKKASQAGMKILKNGGNAMDAAIATAATLSIVIPNMNGLGGDSIALWYSSKNKKILTINGSGKSPKKANISYFKTLGLKKIPQRGPLSITVPGVVDAWDVSLKKFGKKKLKDVLNDAIKLAENGIKIDKYLNDFLKGDVYKKLIKNNKNLSNIYGLPKDIRLGKIIKQKKLAETLKVLAKHGSKSFYKGSLSKVILEDLQLQGSILDKNDFINHSTLIQKPINTEYFGKSVFSAPPNSQGLALIGLCNLFNNINQKIEINDYLKVKKEIFFLRDMYCLDPSISKLYRDKNRLKKIKD